MIAAVTKECVARGGTRTTYRITNAGREAFQDEIKRQFEAAGPVSSTLYAALLFLRHVEPKQLMELVRQRIARTETQLAELEPLREEMMPRLKGGAAYLFDHISKASDGSIVLRSINWLSALEAGGEPAASEHN